MSVEVHDDPGSAAAAAAALVVEELRSRRGKLLLAGGDAWRKAFQLIAQQASPADYRGAHLFIGDDRTLPPTHIESLYGMVKRAWLDPGRVPPERIHRIMGELDPERAARLAEDELRSVVGEPVLLDVALLGLAADGTTASIAPGSAALENTERLFVPTETLRRVTATLALINASRKVFFLVTGGSRAEVVRTALCEPPGAALAGLVTGCGEPPRWILDRAAASLL